MSKMYDGILGLAIGDALGVPVEFLDRDYLKNNKIEDMKGYGSHKVPKGTWSDDTSLAIATLDSINEMKYINYDDIMNRYAEWFCNNKYTATGVLFDVGISTAKAIKKYLSGIPALKCGGTSKFDNGNGSLMRIFPAVCYCIDNKIEKESSQKIIDNVSSLTHSHNISKIACNIYYDFVKNLMEGNDLFQALNKIDKDNYKKYYDEESLNQFDRIFNHEIYKLAEKDIKSGGYVVDTLEASIWCIFNTNNYKDAVIKAVNLGDDTDTVGAITGSLAGVIYGKEDIPKNWITDLNSKKYLEFLVNNYENLDLSQDKLNNIR